MWPTHKYRCLWVCVYVKEGERKSYSLFSLSPTPTTPKGFSGMFIWFPSDICYLKWPLLLTFSPPVQPGHDTTIVFLKYASYPPLPHLQECGLVHDSLLLHSHHNFCLLSQTFYYDYICKHSFVPGWTTFFSVLVTLSTCSLHLECCLFPSFLPEGLYSS